MLQRIVDYFRPPRIVTAPAFRELIAGESAFIAQKTANDYCRAKTGAFSHSLFTEKTFLDALARCRWESFAAVLADALVMAEGFLRPAATNLGCEPQVADRLVAMYALVLEAYPLPKHRPEGWGDIIAAFPPRMARARLAAPLDPATIAANSARRMFEVLPIHSTYSASDEEVVASAVKFQIVSLWETLARRVDAGLVAADLARAEDDVAA